MRASDEEENERVAELALTYWPTDSRRSDSGRAVNDHQRAAAVRWPAWQLIRGPNRSDSGLARTKRTISRLGSFLSRFRTNLIVFAQNRRVVVFLHVFVNCDSFWLNTRDLCDVLCELLLRAFSGRQDGHGWASVFPPVCHQHELLSCSPIH